MNQPLPSYRLIEVGPDSIMQAALTAAHRTFTTGATTTAAEIAEAVDLSIAQSRNALTMAAQLRLVEEVKPQSYKYIGDSQLRNSPRSGLPQFFRQSAQAYLP